jgi:hypothetical protein
MPASIHYGPPDVNCEISFHIMMRSEKFANIILIAATNRSGRSGGEIVGRRDRMAVKNGIAGTAHTTNLVEHGIVSDKLIEYHAACAARGVGLTIRGRDFQIVPGRPIRQRAQSVNGMQSAVVVRGQQTRGELEDWRRVACMISKSGSAS